MLDTDEGARTLGELASAPITASTAAPARSSSTRSSAAPFTWR